MICSPRRLTKPDKDKFNYLQQVGWESEYLNRAANHGIVVFWLAKEDEKVEGRSFAQTTRWEIAEWWAKGQRIKDFKMIVGADKEFDGLRYIKYKFSQTDKDFEFVSSLDKMAEKILTEIKYGF